MRKFLLRGRLATAALLLGVAATTSLVLACSRLTDPLLDAPDPDLIDPANLQNADGAQGLYVGAIGRLRTATTTAESTWLFGGLLADEWSTSSTFIQNDEADQRSIKLDNGSVRDQFRALERVRTASNQAIASLRQYRPTEVTKVGELYFARGFAEMQLAQDFCNGIPLSDGSGAAFVLGTPQSVAEVFTVAIASYDSGLALVTGTDTISVSVNRALRVGKARALVGLNRLPEAAALVTAALVPTTASYDVTMSKVGGTNILWAQPASARRYTVGDSLEGNARNLFVLNAIPFFSAQDPRLPVRYTVSTSGKDTTKSQDGFTFSRTTTLWGELTKAPLTNGIDARLIQAEERLQAGDYVGMMTILNALRTAPPKIGEVQPAAMTVLPLPVGNVAAENLFFREKAFWTFSRGQRLNDLRRLIRAYGRTPATTFPVGTHYRGGPYGSDVNLPVPYDETTNPNFVKCTNRDA